MNKKTSVLLLALALWRPAHGLTLREAVERVLAHSPSLAAAEAARSEAAASERLARDAFHPEAWATTTPGYSSGLPTAIAGRAPAIAGLEVRQTLYDRSSRSAVFQSEARTAVESGAAEKSRRETARAAALLYARCWSGNARIASARQRQSASERILERVALLAREGRRTELDVERSALEAARARQKTLDAESDRDLDFRELQLAIGAEPGSPLEIAEDPVPAIESVSIGDLRADPILRSIELELESLRRSEEIARQALSPVVEAAGQYLRLSRANGYDRYYRSFKADDWSVGLSIAIPLWSGGRVADSRAKIESRISAAEADRRGRRASVDLAVARAESALDRATAGLSLAQRAEGVSRETLRQSESLRREGRGGPDDVEQRAIELSASEEESLGARLDWLTARCDLLSLSGELAALGR
jgi:outer membrane protein